MTVRAKVLLGGLFLLHALPFLSRPALIGGDEPHYALAGHSLAIDGDVDLEADYLEVERGSKAAGRKFAGRRLDRHLVEFDGKLHFSHPLGLPALAAPLLAVLEAASPGAAPDLVLGGLGLVLSFLALLAGYGLLRDLGLRTTEARLLVFALYFATPLWFYSRVLFTESYSWSLAVLSLYLLRRDRWRLASICLGSIFLFKESNVLLILPVLAVVWRRYGLARAALFGLGPVGVFLVWVVKNLWIYGEPLVTFQPFQLGDPLAGALGLLFGPRHGLLPFAPVLVLALAAAVWRAVPRGDWLDLELASLAAFVAVFALTASWVLWGGGSCYGPRLLVPAIPALAVPLALAWRGLRRRAIGRAAFGLLAGLGFAVQFLAATDPFHAFWEIPLTQLLAARPAMLTIGLAAGLGTAVALVWAATPPSGGAGAATGPPV